MERSISPQAEAIASRFTHETFTKHLLERKAVEWAAFFLPHLRPGMSLIDCGCGPGTITLDFAELLAPAQVVGFDIAASHVERGRALAAERGVSNVRFEVADIYEIPFPDNSFDAAFAHTVLQHLKDPVRALREIHRVLKPGGVIGLREEDWDGLVVTPSTPLQRASLELIWKRWEQDSGSPFFARRHREVLREAGFSQVKASASSNCHGTPEATRHWGRATAQYIMEAHIANKIIEKGWADLATLKEMADAWRTWGEHPDAYWAMVWCEAVAWKG
jgi:ubiquinone/menaquinone biosynthesis C-methylase UbiE